MGGLAEKKLTVWQKRNEKLKSAETEHGQHSPFPPYFGNFSANFVCFQPFCLVSAIYLPIFLPFLPVFESLFSNFFPNLKTDRTVWHKRMVHQLGRTELDNLAPPERIFFWQNRNEFWQKEIAGPPSKMPQERLWLVQYYYYFTV